MGVSTVILNNTTLMTVNDTTATASDVSSGTYFYGADGVKTAGTATAHAIGVNDTTDAAGGTIREFVGVDLGSDTVTAEHLELGYTAHDATGTAITGVLAPSWTLLKTQDVTVNTSSTSAATVADIEYTYNGNIDARDYLYYVTVFDKAGQRNGYFYGSIAFWAFARSINTSAFGGVSCFRVTSGNLTGASDRLNGVYCNDLAFNGSNKITAHIYSKYNSTFSQTIDGTYKVDLYALNWPSTPPMK